MNTEGEKVMRYIVQSDIRLSKINRNIYGNFSEHLGRCIYNGIFVGKDSPIDNVRGMRCDIVEALRYAKLPILRWPGGCFADEYHWKDGIGPISGRKKMINTHWGGDTQFFEEQVLSKAVGLSCISGYMGNSAGGLGLSVSTGGSAAFLYNNTMNVFDPDFIEFIGEKIPKTLETFNNSPYILGLYSDNEIPAQEDMLYCYLTIDAVEPVNAFSYATAWTWFMRATGKANPTTADITPELSEEFKAFVYNRYFKTITETIDAAGGGKYMYMGNRIHGQNKSSEGYLRAASQYVDILTVNLYGGLEPPIETIKYMYKYTGKPFIVTEFFAKGNDAVDMNGYALGNQTNAGWIVNTQEDRAIHYENYALLLLESQTCVGWTWYRFRDNDQTIYQDSAGNLYRVYDYRNKKIDAYANVKTGEVIEATKLDGKLTVYYKGESDTSNLGSNKGIYDNKMNLYEELASAVTIISDNLFNIIEYFDNLHK